MRFPAFIVFVFDALRRDMITPEHAPNLRAFIDAGTDFPLSRAVFPSVTRVNAAALACGAAPGATGIIANKFFDPNVFPDRSIHTGLHDHIRAAESAYGGRFVAAATLGDTLAQHGLKVAVVSTGSAGTTHLLNPRAVVLGHVTLCLSDWRASTPAAYASAILERFGPIPPAARPNLGRIRLQTDIALDAVLPEIEPDVLVLWMSDPDSTYHHCGIGSPESLAAIRNIDAQFARVTERWRAAAGGERCRVIVCSDHGQVTARERVEVKSAMREAGLAIGSALTGENRLAGSTGYYGAISVAGADPARIAKAARWLQEQPWCGYVFTPGGDGVRGGAPGTLDRTLLGLGHARTPEIYYAMAADDGRNRWGFAGSCYFDSEEVPVGGGTHGGLHPLEMSVLLAMQGEGVRRSYRSPWPASHTDIAPTILSRLGFPTPATMSGRVLVEAGEAATTAPPPTETQEVGVEAGRYRQCLRLWRVGATVYVDHGWIEDDRR